MKIIGRFEKINFPELNLYQIDAKIDTGAYTSSLHCHHIVEEEHDGKTMVRFRILDTDHSDYQKIDFLLPVYKKKKVKSSTGTSNLRFFIQTTIHLFNKSIPIELSLTDRSQMKYPVLLGRKLLKNRFLVDVSKKYIFNQE